MAILCPEHDLLYIRVPATGSSVVARILEEELGGISVTEQALREEGRIAVPRTHVTVPELVDGDILSRDVLGSCLVVANVRNPFDRWTTYYQRRAGDDWIDYSFGVRKRQIERDREHLHLSAGEYERRQRTLEERKQEQKRKGRRMRWVGFNNWMKYTLLRWWWKRGRSNGRGLSEYAFPMLSGVDVAIRQEQLNKGVNRVLEIAGADEQVELPEKNKTSGKKPYTEYYAWSTRVLAENMFASEMKRFGYGFSGPVDDEPVVSLNNEQVS
jgi:hypothetical protein